MDSHKARERGKGGEMGEMYVAPDIRDVDLSCNRFGHAGCAGECERVVGGGGGGLFRLYESQAFYICTLSQNRASEPGC